MSDRIRCNCRRCTTRSLMGPAIIITVGVLFLLDQMRGGYFSFNNTWPVILLVIGAIQLMCALSPTEGHIGNGYVPPTSPGAMPPAPPNSLPGQGR
jgi:cell wall-active antibiotic response 4TMS protein YvqF